MKKGGHNQFLRDIYRHSEEEKIIDCRLHLNYYLHTRVIIFQLLQPQTGSK